jgi:hypothetical protein
LSERSGVVAHEDDVARIEFLDEPSDESGASAIRSFVSGENLTKSR